MEKKEELTISRFKFKRVIVHLSDQLFFIGRFILCSLK